ncbi:MAG: hypothetical protein QNJ46_17690 [Leptolyngbyaceae cyanobacterium MO_188.B28]|nr:hypothetical protein [Leptolyngbyaceae cyanobacterium MO_188.B28]
MIFIDQMRFVRDRSLITFGWQDYYGVPTVRSLVIRKRQVVGGKMQEEYIDIQPKPVITTVDEKQVGTPFNESIQIEIDDFMVKGVSRQGCGYDFLNFRDTGVEFWVDAQLLGGWNGPVWTPYQIVGGIPCDFLAITKSNTLTWDLLLRRKPDDRYPDHV